jgi:hypothetical protein
VFAVTESSRGADDLVEDCLEPFGASNSSEHAAKRTMLRTQVLNLAGEFYRLVG